MFSDLFPGIKADVIANVLEEKSVEIPDGFRFSDTNIIIGPNGAGKTRFLNALRELYGKSKNTALLYGYFPDLLSRRPPKAKRLRRHTLQQYRDMEGITFDDFFQEIEAQSEKFFLRVLNPESESEDQANSATLEQVSHFFSALTGKSITAEGILYDDGEKEQTLIVEEDQRQVPLETALDQISPGERMLLYMSVFMALQKKSRKNEVIILDEPESHLHPKALLEFIRFLTESFTGATIWIATHSLFLLPEFEFENIVYVEGGKIQKRDSKLYQSVVAGVLGEGHENVSRFFMSYAQWQYYGFIKNCFEHPKVHKEVNSKDPQVSELVRIIWNRPNSRILDFGGGSGRVGLSLAEALLPHWDNITYDLYDPCPSYKGNAFRVYSKLEDCEGHYDCVVMMNVLHEIVPEEWPNTFRQIYDLLSPDGILIFVEVKALRDGEYPNEIGYMLLGDMEMDILFCDNNHLSEEERAACYAGSSFVFCYERDVLKNATEETVHAAIKHLEERTLQEIVQLRNAEKERKEREARGEKLSPAELSKKGAEARRYAFLTQQYINAKLYNVNAVVKTSPVKTLEQLRELAAAADRVAN